MMNESEFRRLPVPVALVVDDEPLIRMDTSDIVADEGYHVLEARTADEAFAFLKQHNTLKLVFTDVQMPGEMDGLELARHIAANWPNILVIVASGAVTPPKGALPSTARFIPKPISVTLVRETLKELYGTEPVLAS
jgi:CheY-like chemotaxis protein